MAWHVTWEKADKARKHAGLRGSIRAKRTERKQRQIGSVSNKLATNFYFLNLYSKFFQGAMTIDLIGKVVPEGMA